MILGSYFVDFACSCPDDFSSDNNEAFRIQLQDFVGDLSGARRKTTTRSYPSVTIDYEQSIVTPRLRISEISADVLVRFGLVAGEIGSGSLVAVATEE
ncbi:hypothetical protein [Nocardia aurantia]|uniref:hypothetical protein n=1 Tax=Nocardia aurantia TaxID=2585199 RepID=UPI001D107DAA|nr:hypothetical protein [Nocardia aurantia]